MSDVIYKQLNLSLNASWQPVSIRSIGAAIVNLYSSGVNNEDKCLAIDIEYKLDENGLPDFDAEPMWIRPLNWEDWLKVEIHPWDLTINSARMKIRAPTVTVASNFNDMPKKKFNDKPSKDGVRLRDKNTCQYTGVKLDNKTFSLDHVIPLNRGGEDKWENVVSCHKGLNSKKGNRLNSELNLKLLKTPTKPKPVPLCALFTEAKHHTWKHFLINQEN